MTADTTIDLNLANGNDSKVFSSNSSLGSSKSRFKYRGKMMAMRAMNQLPPVEENNRQAPPDGFRPLNKSRRAKWISVASIVTYLFIGTLTYALWIPGWNFADSVYFCMATITTVGFGDIAPLTEGQKAFTIFYIIGGTFLIGGIFVGYLCDHIFNSFEDISKNAKNLTCDYFLQRLDNGGGDKSFFFEDRENFWGEFCTTFRKTIPLLVALIVPPLIMGYYEDWGVLDTFYFTVVSSSTVGYGNVAPTGIWTRLITVIYLPFCVAVIANAFSKLTSVYLRHKAKTNEQEFFNRKLSENDFELMDVEGESAVGYDEFLVFMLVAMGKVSPEDIQKMEELYQRLDADSETHLKIEDLFTMAYGELKEV